MLISKNPATEELIKEYEEHSVEEVNAKIDTARHAYFAWRTTTFAHRSRLFHKLADTLLQRKEQLGELITREVGKPITASIGEIEKCALVCRHYADHAQKYLKNESIATEAIDSHISFEPLGGIFAVMPWNFPFWQVFRFAAPALMAGNVGLLKHASNVSGCALAIEDLFGESGFESGIFTTLLLPSSRTDAVIAHPFVKAVALTGSEAAGAHVAALAASHLKKSVLELGGSDPFIVCEDAPVEEATTAAVMGRLVAGGQSCIAAKRFIVHKSKFEEFVRLFKIKMEKVIIGNPLDVATQIGSLSSESIRNTIETQVKRSVELGAAIVCGGARWGTKGYFYLPTILTHVKLDMPVMCEEVFGPVAPVISFSTDDEALHIANSTHYGLGASLWTNDPKKIDRYTREIEAGCVFVNSIVKSDPRMPFGGIKMSGYGRELGQYGIREFVNTKSVWVDIHNYKVANR